MMVMAIVDQVSYSVLLLYIIEDDGDLRSMFTQFSKAQPLATSRNTTPYGLPTGVRALTFWGASVFPKEERLSETSGFIDRPPLESRSTVCFPKDRAA